MTEESKSMFSNSDMEIGNYRKISGLAIISFAFALLACLVAFSNKSFLFLPIVTAVISVLVLILMHRSKKKLLGFSLAAAALFISLFSFTLFTTFHQKRYNRIQKAAIEHGNTWLKLLKTKQPQIAYQLHIPIQNRKERGFNLIDHYGTIENPKPELAEYLAMEPEKSIIADGESAKIEIETVVAKLESRTRTDDFYIVYRYERDGEDEPRLFSCILRRIDSLVSGPQWHILRVKNEVPKIERKLPAEWKIVL